MSPATEPPAKPPSTETASADTTATEPPKTAGRVFLVVVDESPELKVALLYACRRAQKTGGRVALLHVAETGDFQQFFGVGKVMAQETRQAAEALMQKMAAEVYRLSGAMPVLYLREGDRRDELIKLINEEPSISILVLGASTSSKGPGPLVSALSGKFVGKLRVPLTIVPGNLSDQDIQSIA
jgi:nucleotide-binding universal stress UspA family protein